MVKRLAILTHHWVPNFGANLQALSTFLYLTQLGHDVTVLNYRPLSIEQHSAATVRPDQIAMHNRHSDSFLKQSAVLRTEQDLIAFCTEMKFDNIIAGSDSILRIKKSVKTEEGSFPNPFWLRWVQQLPEGSRCNAAFLAASCEGSYYFLLNRHVKKRISNALLSVNHVTVRDRWTKTMIRHVTKGEVDPQLCSDPVSILNDVIDFETYYEYFSESIAMKGKYILLCTSPRYLTPDWAKRFVALAHAQGLEVFALPLPSRETNLPVDRILHLPMSPLSWYGWIRNAAGIITVNFHPVACSVFNDVPFVSIDISGPMYFRAISLRQTSKTFDLCMNIKAENHSFLPLVARYLLSPQRAMKLISTGDGSHGKEYRKNANQLFKGTIAEILGN